MTIGPFIRRGGFWQPLSNVIAPMALPVGLGIATYQQAIAAGATDIPSAMAYAATLGGPAVKTLTFPTGEYDFPLDFSANSCPLLSPATVQCIGQGPTYTRFVAKGPFTMAANAIPRTTNSTNPFYLWRTTGGGPAKTFGGFSIDGSALDALASPWSAAVNYTTNALVKLGGRVFRSLQTSNLNHTPLGGVLSQTGDTWWEDIFFGGFMMHLEANPTAHDILLEGLHGYANGPPGESFMFNWYKCTGIVTETNLECNGQGNAACGIGYNSNNVDCRYVITNRKTYAMGYSHGSSFYQCKDADIYNDLSYNNGTSLTGGSSSGAGANNEETYGTIIYHSPTWYNNSLVGMRVEAGDNGGVDNPNFQVINPTIYGSKYGIWLAPTGASHGNAQIQVSPVGVTGGGSITGIVSPTHSGAY